jgi:hypothetical protein
MDMISGLRQQAAELKQQKEEAAAKAEADQTEVDALEEGAPLPSSGEEDPKPA